MFTFFGPITPQDLDRNVKAVFGELNVPVLENLSAQLAVRYETYGGNVGSTTNPKLSLRWQALDWFGLRGSVGTTFRGPLQTQLLNTPPLAWPSCRPPARSELSTTVGNPNLEPEEAFTFNVGMIVKAGGFAGTVDYWSYDFEKSLENESGTEIVAAFFGTTATSPNQCNNAGVRRPADALHLPGWRLQHRQLDRVRGPTPSTVPIRRSRVSMRACRICSKSVLGGDLLVGDGCDLHAGIRA